jgi:hypothetical protein
VDVEVGHKIWSGRDYIRKRKARRISAATWISQHFRIGDYSKVGKDATNTKHLGKNVAITEKRNRNF